MVSNLVAILLDSATVFCKNIWSCPVFRLPKEAIEHLQIDVGGEVNIELDLENRRIIIFLENPQKNRELRPKICPAGGRIY
jgi:hypothetical protein